MIRGQKLPQQAGRKINIDVEMGIHNRFDIEVVNIKTGQIRQRAVGYNVICNQLWTKLLTPTTYFNYIHYGTGTGTPATTDTSLFQFLGYGAINADNETRVIDEAAGVGYLRRSIQLAPETAAGATITEVGIAFGSAASNLCTHAMLQDMNGNPISIIKTDTDVINIYATVYCHFNPKGYMNGSVHFISHTQNVAFLKSICGGYNSQGWPNAAFGYEAWGMVYYGVDGADRAVAVNKSYDVANRKMICTLGRFSVNSNNRPLREIMLFAYNYTGGSSGGSASGPCILLQPGVEGGWFPPYRIEGEALGTGDGQKTVFNTAFPFATNPKVYVDGVEVTEGVTVSHGLNQCAHPNRFISCIKGDSTVEQVIPAGYDITTDCDHAYDASDNTGMYVYTNHWYYFYNPVADTSPITKINAPYCTVEASEDMVHWTTVFVMSSTETKDVPAEYRHYPFWREQRSQSYAPSWGSNNHYGTFYMDATGGNVTFDEPPAIGSVITIDYTTSVIPKDENHVLDVTVTLQFSEYIED